MRLYMSKKIAIILAAGTGSRAEQNIPKQFVMVHDKPILVYTLEKFEKSEVIDEICVVTGEEWIEEVENYYSKYHITKLKYVVSGGKSGLESLKNGVVCVNAKDNDLIIVHDGVRPFVTGEIIKNNVEVAKNYDVTVTSIPCVETLIKSEDEKSSSQMIPRDGMYRVQTPQTFKYRCICDLFEKAEELTPEKAPSVFALYMLINKGTVYMSQGSEKNIKLTYPADIEYFKEFF